jgi:uncharacterized protein YecT (DUF1311 family)
MKHFYLGCLLLAVSLSAASTSFAGDDCEKSLGNEGLPATTQTAMSFCAAEQWKFQDNLLNETYARAAATYQGVELNSLRTMQRSWLEFRDTACLFAIGGTFENQGTIVPMLYNICLRNLTKSQREFLEIDLTDLCDRGTETACKKQ